ncbi:DUF6575 domain-containing protein [Priestia megaterium]|uniref:DUF6575 domain-containing protein n=1 Tax=Priestia megaterium TaxID=1404 RepID=UPI003D295CD0
MEINKYSDLAQTEIIHTFEYYDFPLFFISKSTNAEYYLNYYIEEIENGIDKWLFSRISNKERVDLIEQRTSVLTLLNHLFKKERLYHLFVNQILTEPDAPLSIELVNASNFDPESFPEEDFYVEYDYVTKESLTKVEEDVLDSTKFKIVLKDDRNSHDISLDLFLNVLSNFKKSLNEIANNVGNKLMGQQTNNQINLRVDSLQPSSFGVWLRTEPLEADLFEIPEKSLNNLFEIIKDVSYKSVQEIEEQIELDEDYSLNTIKNVRTMLKEISDNKFSLKLEGNMKSNGSISKEVKFDEDSYNKLEVLNEILKKNSQEYSEMIEVEGILTSVNTTYNNFRITTTTIGDVKGSMSRELMDKLKNEMSLQFKVPSMIKANIEKKIKNDLAEDIHSVKYILTSFEQPN